MPKKRRSSGQIKGLPRKEKAILLSATILSLIALSLLILLYEKRAFSLADGVGFVQDDSWIHFTLAKRITEGEWFCINPGEPTAVSTSPLWTLFVAALYKLTSGSVIAVHIAGVAILILCGTAVFLLSLRLFSNFSLATASSFLVMLEWHIIFFSLSGMETLLFSALSILAIWSADEEPSVKTGLFCGLLTLCRPEGVILTSIILLHFITKKRYSLAPIIIPFLLLILPVVIFNHTVSGNILPNTFYAKHTYYGKGFSRYMADVVEYFGISHLGLLLPGFVASFYYQGKEVLKRRLEILSLSGLYFVGVIIAYGVFLPRLYTFGRYIVPLIPLYILFGLSFGYNLLKRYKKMWVVYLLIVSTAFIYTSIKKSEVYAYCVENINSLNVAIGKWLKENTEESAVIATHDIGAIPYFSERYIVDTLGLANLETVKFFGDEQGLLRYLRERRVDYIVSYPFVYPKIFEREDVWPVYYTKASAPTLGGAWHTMVVYKTGWR